MKFIMVFDKKSADKLKELGYRVVMEKDGRTYFSNDNPLLKFDLKDDEYVYTSTMTF